MKTKLVVIVGETASGKSALAMEIARQVSGEIIAADAMTVRREVNIGTAKPTPKQQSEITHHLLDVVEPCSDFTAAVFKDLTNKAITDISSRGKLPIMVGGTGLYVDGVIFDFSFMQPGSAEERRALNALSISELLEKINQQGIDLTGIDLQNKRRLIRLLVTGGTRPTSSELRPSTLIIGLTTSRTKLRQNIEQRVEQMFKQGLKREVAELADKYSWECEALKGIGYREWQGYFAGMQSGQETKRKIIKSTLDLAKRQRTWFKRNQSIKWVEDANEAIKLVREFVVN